MDSSEIASIDTQGRRNWTDTAIGKTAAGLIVAAEISPLNEAVRVAAFAAAMHYGDSALASAAVLAGTTLAVEGSAGLATADLLDSEGGNTAVARANRGLQRLGIDKFLNTNAVTEAGLAMVGGSAIVTVAKHRQDPERTRETNRRYAMVSALGITALSGLQGLAIANGIEHPDPATLGVTTLAVGAGYGAYRWAKNRIKSDGDGTRESSISEAGFAPQRLGLSPEDRERALQNPDTVLLDGEPVLTPLSELSWYNIDFLQEQYGTDRLFYYSHPGIGTDEQEKVHQILHDTVRSGGVIVYDTVTSNGKTFGDISIDLDESEFKNEKLGKGQDRYLDQYTGEVQFKEQKQVHYERSPSAFETYAEAVMSGRIEFDPQNGPALVEKIEGDEAEKLWNIYDEPFAHLGKDHPIKAGFDKDGFMEALKDKDVIKVVNRKDGNITTLALCVTDFRHCPWLDEEYYKENYPEAYDTDNILIFTGIVTDKEHRGNSYSLALMDLLMKVHQERNTSTVVTFECGDISAKYIPKAVRYAIWRSGAGKLTGVKSQDSRLNYYALTDNSSESGQSDEFDS